MHSAEFSITGTDMRRSVRKIAEINLGDGIDANDGIIDGEVSKL
jgi:hypothetical protein